MQESRVIGRTMGAQPARSGGQFRLSLPAVDSGATRLDAEMKTVMCCRSVGGRV